MSAFIVLMPSVGSAAVALQDTAPIKRPTLAPVQDAAAPADRSEPNTPESDGLQPDEDQLILDVKHQPKPTPGDEIAYQACITEQEAARLRNEILVCRRLKDDVGDPVLIRRAGNANMLNARKGSRHPMPTVWPQVRSIAPTDQPLLLQ